MALNLKPFLGLIFGLSSIVFFGFSPAIAQDNLTIASTLKAALPEDLIKSKSGNWRDEIGTFKIGLVRGWSSDMSGSALARVENIFSKSLGTPVKVVLFERFVSLMDAQAEGRVDLAAYSARAFSTLQLMCECVDALASPTTVSGNTGQIAVLAGDSLALPNLADIGRSKLGRLALSNIASTDMLRGVTVFNRRPANGNEPFWVDYSDYSSLSKAYEANEIDGFVISAAATFVDRAAAGADELKLIENSGRPTSILWRSPFWPYGPVAVRSNLAAEAKANILALLEQIDVTAPLVHSTLSEGLVGPFRKTDMAGYANVSASIRNLVSQNATWR